MGDLIKQGAGLVGGALGGPLGAAAGNAIGGMFGSGPQQQTGPGAMQQALDPRYKGAYETDYWKKDSNEDKYMQTQMNQLAQNYAGQKGQVMGELQNQTAGQPGSLSQFALAQRADNPYFKAQADLQNKQYEKRFEGEQNQYQRQGQYNQTQAGAVAQGMGQQQGLDERLNKENRDNIAQIAGQAGQAIGAGLQQFANPSTPAKTGRVATAAPGGQPQGLFQRGGRAVDNTVKKVFG